MVLQVQGKTALQCQHLANILCVRLFVGVTGDCFSIWLLELRFFSVSHCAQFGASKTIHNLNKEKCQKLKTKTRRRKNRGKREIKKLLEREILILTKLVGTIQWLECVISIIWLELLVPNTSVSRHFLNNSNFFPFILLCLQTFNPGNAGPLCQYIYIYIYIYLCVCV